MPEDEVHPLSDLVLLGDPFRHALLLEGPVEDDGKVNVAGFDRVDQEREELHGAVPLAATCPIYASGFHNFFYSKMLR